MEPTETPALPERKPAPEREIRSFAFDVEDVRAAQNGRTDDFVIKGHASVFNTWTDLGPFRERIAKGAFDDVLQRDPHVLHLIDHDTRYVLSSTRNKTLELTAKPRGLHMWSKVAPTSYAADLRVLMERGDVSQSSFAFTVAEDEWVIRGDGDDEVVERTINRIGELYDVTTTAMGAYPTTDSQVASRTLARARSEGRLPESHPAETTADADPDAGAVERTDSPPDTGAEPEETSAAQAPPAASAVRLNRFKERVRKAAEKAREAADEMTREVYRT